MRTHFGKSLFILLLALLLPVLGGCGKTSDADQAGADTGGAAISVTLQEPQDGAIIEGDRVLVTGSVTHALDQETGVTVNGLPAALSGKVFTVSGLPLVEGANTLTIVARDKSGQTSTKTITISAILPAERITLTASPASGLAPLAVTFFVEAKLKDAVKRYEIDFDGDGVVDHTGATVENISHTYTVEGMHQARITITDVSDKPHTGRTTVIIQSRRELETLLEGKWGAMKTQLLEGNIDAALTHFVQGSREEYRAMFSGMGKEELREIFAGIDAIEVSTLYGKVASCGLVRKEDGKDYSYPLTFVQDADGLWKILGF